LSNIFVYFIPKMHVYGSQYSTALEEWGPSMLFSKNSSVPPTLYILAAMTGCFCVILIITSSCFKNLRQIHQCNLGSVRSVSPPDDISRSRHFSGFSVFLLFSHVTSFVLRRLWFSLRTILMSFKDYISCRVSNFVIFCAKNYVKASNLRSITTFK